MDDINLQVDVFRGTAKEGADDKEITHRLTGLLRLTQRVLDVETAFVVLYDVPAKGRIKIYGLGPDPQIAPEGVFDPALLPTEGIVTIADLSAVRRGPLASDLSFYLAHALKSDSGDAIGALVLCDTAHKKFRERENEEIRELAQIAEAQAQFVEARLVERHFRQAFESICTANRDLEDNFRAMREAFGRYVPKDLAEAIANTPDDIVLQGERREVTILFADIRGFTPLSERLAPEAVVMLLDTFLDVMFEVIEAHGGSIENVVGDAVVARFASISSARQNARAGISCAVAMQAAMATVNGRLASLGLPEISIGIGVNSGEAVVGNIGTDRHLKYTAIGGPVNVASRIEAFAIGGQILACESTVSVADSYAKTDGKLRINVRGIDEAISVFEIVGCGTGIDDTGVSISTEDIAGDNCIPFPTDQLELP